MLIHAAAESAKDIVPGTFAIALWADSEEDLLCLEEKLFEAGIAHSSYRESDQPYSNELMAVGIQPVERRVVKRFVRKFKLVGHGGAMGIGHSVGSSPASSILLV